LDGKHLTGLLTFLVLNPVLFEEEKDDSQKGTLSLKSKHEKNHMTSSNKHDSQSAVAT
jgi:hypothetical protein